MIDRIIELSVNNRLLVVIALIGLTAWGVISYNQIPIDAFPDVTNNQVQILTTAEGFSPIEVEKLITYPVEIEMNSLPGLIENRSISQFSLSSITLVFEDEIDIYWARQQIMERLIAVREELPEGIEPEMGPVSTGLGEVYQYTLESETMTSMEIREIHDWVIAPVLRGVKGVIEVNSFGGFAKQYHITLDPDLMQNYDVSLDEIWESVENNNENAGGNYIVRTDEQYVVRGIGLIESMDDIENIVVRQTRGIPVLIRDIGRVEIQPQVRYGAASKDGRGEAIVGIIMMLKGESGREVVLRVKEAIRKLEPALPGDLKIVPYYDRIDLVNKAIGTVTKALLIGGILVILVLVVFLGNFRSSVIVTLVLPIAVLITFIVMKVLGFSSNLMSLGGLAIGIGMMVDGGVVVIENIVRLVQENQTSDKKEKFSKLVIRGAKEVGRPAFFAVLVVVSVFLPLFTLEDLEGKMFTPLAITISIALFVSLLLAITMAPALATFLLNRKMSEKENPVLRFFKTMYRPVLGFALKRKMPVIGSAAAVTVLGFLVLTRLGTEFVPILEEGSIAIQSFRLPSTSVEKSVEIAGIVEKQVLKTPEVITIISRTGRAEVATDPMLPSISDIYVIMKPLDQWRDGFSKHMIVEEIRTNLETIPGVLFGFSQPIALRVDELISGVKSQLAVKIFGEDMELMTQKAEEIAEILKQIPGARDVKAEQTSGFGYLQVEIDRKALSRFGLNTKEVQEYVRIAIGGGTVSTLYEGEKRFDIVIRFDESHRKDLETIAKILVATPEGQRLPLSNFANLYYEEGPAQVSREDGRRKITVELNIEDVDIGSFVETAQQKIASVDLPPGYLLTWGGQFENQQRANARLAIILPATLALIFLLLFFTFGSVKNTVLVFLNIPFSVVGGITALWIADLYFSVPASVGFIALIGASVMNGIIMVSFINRLRLEGSPTAEAVKNGALLRLRPILMTSLSTLLGLIPLLFAQGIGSEIQRPLAAVVVGGLLTSTFSTLVILPVLYGWFERKNDQ